MSSPYRDGDQSDPTDAPRDGGIVGDVIAQFADPYAFYRELVQNAIDAGSAEVHVEITYDAGERRVKAAVRDRGEGMTREIIENQLLVLFRSTKEKDTSKIGKFGVGFASVLSPSPEVVIVNTARDGKRLTLHLYRDLTYELFDSGRASQAGTTVEIEIAKGPGELAEFERHSREALTRWCRHASVPIHLRMRDREVRIDTPLALDKALVEVRRTYDGGALTVVAALTRDTKPYVGFFNHGLMLHEAGDLLGNVAVKIQDSRLGHTISRDDVRRDAHYDHAVSTARELVEDALPDAIGVKLRELLEADDRRGYSDLVDACIAAKVMPSVWHFPLVEPVGGKMVIEGAKLNGRVWTADDSDALSQALAASREPVVLSYARAGLLAARFSVVEVEEELIGVQASAGPTEHDVALLATLNELLEAAYRSPANIVLVTVSGAREDLLAVALPTTDARMVHRKDATKNPFALFGLRTLGLSEKHPHVAAARNAEDPVLAAAHLARAVLLQFSLLDEKRSHAITLQALDRIGVRE